MLKSLGSPASADIKGKVDKSARARPNKTFFIEGSSFKIYEISRVVNASAVLKHLSSYRIGTEIEIVIFNPFPNRRRKIVKYSLVYGA